MARPNSKIALVHAAAATCEAAKETIMDASKMRAFSYSGYDGCGHPQDLLDQVATGLAAVRQAILGFDFDHTPSPQAVTGIANILEGLSATLEGVNPLLEERLADRCTKLPGAAEDECETDRLIAAYKEGAAKARQHPNAPIWDLWYYSDEARKRRAAEGPIPEGEPEHGAAE